MDIKWTIFTFGGSGEIFAFLYVVFWCTKSESIKIVCFAFCILKKKSLKSKSLYSGNICAEQPGLKVMKIRFPGLRRPVSTNWLTLAISSIASAKSVTFFVRSISLLLFNFRSNYIPWSAQGVEFRSESVQVFHTSSDDTRFRVERVVTLPGWGCSTASCLSSSLKNRGRWFRLGRISIFSQRKNI